MLPKKRDTNVRFCALFGIVEPMTGSLDSILVKAQTVVKDDVLLIASRPERSGGVHKGVFIQLPRGQLPQGSLGGRCKPAAPAGCMHAPQNPHS